MEIERINENTVKFYITYVDIEDRGFNKEEIWYNRDRSEQLFWQMMDEVNIKEDFNIEGPLWIQVQAMDRGLEVVVTKAQLSNDGQNLELPDENGKGLEIPMEEKLESMIQSQYGEDQTSEESKEDAVQSHGDDLSFVLEFKDFEHVIQLSHYFNNNEMVADQLYHFEDKYFLYVEFGEEDQTDEEQENILSQLLEFGSESTMTVYRLEEYGKVIFNEDALQNIRSYFPQS
ncbi:adaptor protein [Pontibacillus halophilus JSM 076056 = DSM 19796]|uniref:Adapter protein MecA n=1 Tax=Pontibacillus halophilus JSM 076056 = DSM 19796 TaxID=1385510 RepID=A0A0A5GN70_9BACI|nr:adaptor protein MecA [Pontibacillus halophilus]KGX92698.1 adaptor protein [Pontibacillus halophilus JSM 076056 = DSM 19796]